ncbi:uncharacterized protein FTJAE_5613 [Fusarium tjaetaba]|uniref:F-box domain-containing protein n=1 Tax=Fusarium tjaetaba TaxID=1567544 RepID=A0A8H5RPN5_9HYPO|nr:uncharacterized protein FTJAE_5613 [Fusarium tjaetaba]KAF5637198.1 hypothetical protein FTJAE_5613 [Fusarium tjaetaba]
MAQDECRLLRLSTELIYQILEYSPPTTCFDVALTCATLHSQCLGLLDLHREAYSKYRITSDLSPETVIDLLKDTTKARIERWHVRELEIWGSRYDWEDWRSWVPKLPGTCDLADGSPTRFDTEAIEYRLKDGQDGFLKLILIATCPRLHSLRFAKNDIDRHTTLKWMRKVINECRRARNGPLELRGFESLRHIAVGIETDQSLLNDKSLHRDARDFAALFYIPNLESLYFNDLHYIADGDEPYLHCDVVDQYHFPRGTSSVKHLFIDGASGFSADYYQAIANASKNLESVVLRIASERRQDLHGVDTFVDSLSFSNGKTLQKLILYNPCGMYADYQLLEVEGFGNLKLFTLAVSDMMLGELYQMHSSPNAEQLAEYVSDSFPASTEVLYIWGRSDEHVSDSISNDIPSDILDSTLAALIESGVLENLKVVYLTDVEKRQAQNDTDSPSRGSMDAGLKELLLPKSVAAGLKTGVHVCTVMNRDDGGYWKNFPARPDRFDLKTGPCLLHDPQGRAYDASLTALNCPTDDVLFSSLMSWYGHDELRQSLPLVPHRPLPPTPQALLVHDPPKVPHRLGLIKPRLSYFALSPRRFRNTFEVFVPQRLYCRYPLCQTSLIAPLSKHYPW